MAEYLGLEHIRVTSVSAYKDCPRRWVNEVTGSVKRRSSPYAAIGTAVHLVMEKFLADTHRHDLVDWDYEHLKSVNTPDHEIENARQYALMHRDLKPKLCLLEYEWTLELLPDALPIRGHIDAGYILAEDTLLIEDHKTNRSYENADVWRQRMQPRLYSWAAHKMWPQFRHIVFRIGYPNLGTYVEWDTDPAADEPRLQEYYGDMWRELVVRSLDHKWEEQINSGCSFCGLRDYCEKWRETTSGLRESMAAMAAQQPNVAEQLLFVQQLRKAIVQIEQQLKEQLATEVGDQQRVTMGKLLVTQQYGERRKAEFYETYRTLYNIAGQDGDFAQALVNLSKDLFTVKVGGIDTLVKRFPQYLQQLTALTPKVRNAQPSFEVVPASGMIGGGEADLAEEYGLEIS